MDKGVPEVSDENECHHPLTQAQREHFRGYRDHFRCENLSTLGETSCPLCVRANSLEASNSRSKTVLAEEIAATILYILYSSFASTFTRFVFHHLIRRKCILFKFLPKSIDSPIIHPV
jgi:hypothetical protein